MAYKIKDITSKPSPHAEPRDILSSKERFLFWMEENRGLVWGGILLIIAVVVVGITMNWLSEQKHEQVWELQGKAQNVYLDRPLDDVQKGRENIKQATGMFRELHETFPGTRGADVSLFLWGNSLMEVQDYQGAIEKYQKFIAANPRDVLVTGLVRQRLGLAYLLSGNRESALSTWQAILDDPKTLNKDQILFELAKLAESEENIQEAVAFYKQLMKDHPLSPFAGEAELRVKVLAPEEAKEPTDADLESSNTTEDVSGGRDMEEGGK
jgi:tetratricopeptide (TPR) repeat protein